MTCLHGCVGNIFWCRLNFFRRESRFFDFGQIFMAWVQFFLVRAKIFLGVGQSDFRVRQIEEDRISCDCRGSMVGHGIFGASFSFRVGLRTAGKVKLLFFGTFLLTSLKSSGNFYIPCL